MTTTTYGEFEVANEYLNDHEELEAAFRRQGYLFFRGVLDTDEVGELRDDFVQELRAQGFVKPDSVESLWTGKSLDELDELDDQKLYDLDYYGKLIDTETTQRLFQRVFRGPVFTFRQCTLRYSVPNDSKYGSPAHQDNFYIKHSTDFHTMWIPLMDIDQEIGGLALAEGSHEPGLRNHEEQEVYSYVLKGRKQSGVALEGVAGRHLTTTYNPGDVLVFHSHMVHWGLPNQSEKVRLSIDVRCQPAAAPRSWQVESSIAQTRLLRDEVREIAVEQGAGDELFEALVIQVMARDKRPDQAEVREMIAELSGSQIQTQNA